jgi:hypothetical protein
MEAYISRDEDSNTIWIWLKPRKGNWKPINVTKDFVNFQRPDSMHEIDKYCCYDKSDFKKKFGVGIINKKTCRHIHLPDALVLDNVDAKYGLFFG